MKAKQLAAILVGTTLACVALAATQTQRTQPPRVNAADDQGYDGAFETTRDSRLVGVNVVRLINTAEADYKNAHGSFAGWDELYGSSAITTAQRSWPSTNGLTLASGPEVVKGWFLMLMVSRDGKAYQLSLHNLSDKQCRFSLFSDQSGLIYQGNVIGCEPGEAER